MKRVNVSQRFQIAFFYLESVNSRNERFHVNFELKNIKSKFELF